MMDLSPEEILRKREEEGGLKYDPYAEDLKKETEVNPVTEVRQEEQLYQAPIQPVNNYFESEQQAQPATSLGKSQNFYQQQVPPAARPAERNSPGEIGWKNMPVEILPSKGMFYPSGARMAIRPAEVKEIRHFSTIDEEDRLDIEEKLSYILDRCLSIEFPNEGVVSYKDLKSEDRFFLIIAIRDLTFVKGENSVILLPDTKCEYDTECPVKNGFELRTGVLASYELDPEISKYYDAENRCFTFNVEGVADPMRMYVPSIGVTQKISEFTAYCLKNEIEIDDPFLKIAPFILDEWRTLDNNYMLSVLKKIDNLSKEEFSLYFVLSEKIRIGTKAKASVKCPKCGGREVSAEISFPSGLRSLFVISDILRKLL